MKIVSADFITSSLEAIKRKDNLPEIALIGRSNVGKSSLINMLTGKRHLAKTSSTPGKTKMINYFMINQQWYLVDLPGYGYIHGSKGMAKQLTSVIDNFLSQSPQLYLLLVLIDVRLNPQESDLHFIDAMGRAGVPLGIVFTKADKLPRSKVMSGVKIFQDALTENWDDLPPSFVTSSLKGAGKDEILAYIEKIMNIASEKY